MKVRLVAVRRTLWLSLALLLSGCAGWDHSAGITTNEGPRDGVATRSSGDTSLRGR